MTNIQHFKHEIKPNQNISQLKQEILSKDSTFFTFDFKHAINKVANSENISTQDFWKLAKIKAKKVTLFVDEILSCDFLETTPLGFIRVISMPGSDVTQGKAPDIVRIRERVVIDEDTKTILFFQLETSGKILLCAINQVTEENDNVYFSGHYVYSIPKNSKLPEDLYFMEHSNQTLPSRMKVMIDKMKMLAKTKKVDEVYQQLYS
jgi:hypothetical protein